MSSRETAYLQYHYARFYDWVYDGVTEDIDFFVRAAGEYGAPVLELACGTGRITIPLARGGFDMVGLDLSPEMLAILRNKLDTESAATKSRVRLMEANMADFSLPEKFNLAFIPISSIFHLHTAQEKESCFACVHRHLNHGGAFIIDVTPARLMADQTVGETQEVRRGLNSATGKNTRELNRKLEIDKQAQCVVVEHTYIEEEPGGGEARFAFTDKYSWVTEEQMRQLLTKAGFEQIEVYGDYNKGPFTDTSGRMIFAAGKK